MTPADLLEGLLRCHRAAFPNGDWRGANDAISLSRRMMERDVRAAGLWPNRFAHIPRHPYHPALAIGNEELAKLHREAMA